MSRLEKKCLVASAGAHALLLAVLALAPLLFVSKQPQRITMQVVTLLPSRLVDGISSGGGSPAVKELPAPAPAAPTPRPIVVVPPAPAPVKPQTAPPKPETRAVRDETEAPARPRNRRNGEAVPTDRKITPVEDTEASGEGKPAKRKKVEISLDRDTSGARERAAAEARAQAQAEANARAAQALYASKIKGVLGAISQGVSSGTSIEVPGPGGEAYINYGEFVVQVYRRAWTPPPELADDLATVVATVLIRRDGTVESFRITKRSGHSALDRSVERLAKVGFIAKFPDGVTDERRTFIIDFDLRSKKSI